MRTEEALRHSEATYREIFNAVNDVIYIHDIESGRILDVNDRFLDLFGYTPDEARNMDVGDISSGVGRCTQDGAVERMAKAATGEPQIFEWHCRHRDGHLFWVEVSLRRGVVVGQDRVLAIMRDITEQKRARESLERTQFAMDRARDSVIWVAADGGLAYVNDSACRSLEWSREELLGMRIFDVDPDFPESGWERHKADLRRLGHMSFEGRHITKSGRTFPVEVTSNFFEFEGEWLACAFDRDISERRQRLMRRSCRSPGGCCATCWTPFPCESSGRTWRAGTWAATRPLPGTRAGPTRRAWSARTTSVSSTTRAPRHTAPTTSR